VGETDYTITRYISIDEIDQTCWDRVVADGDIVNSYAYLSAVEHSCLANIEHRYFEMYRESELVAHASVCLFTFSLDLLLGGIAKRIIVALGSVVRKLLTVTVVECGHPTAIGSSIVVREGEDLRPVLRVIDLELTAIAADAHTSFVDIRDVYAAERGRYSELSKVGYRTMSNMANTYFRVYQRTYAEYVSDLVAKRRYEVLRRRREFEGQGGSIEKVVDFASIASELQRLWENTYGQAIEYQREVLNADYFRLLSDRLGDMSFVLLCKKGDTLIGFTMMIDSGDTLISTYCGLDYASNRSMYTYFMLFYRSIEEAINLGKTWLELGVTNYSPKIEIGAIPKPMYVYTKSTKPLVNALLMPILTWLSKPRVFEKHRIFNSRFFDRHRTGGDMVALIAGKRYQVRDVSAEGVGVEGGPLVAAKRIMIEVFDNDGVFVRLSGKLQNSSRIDDVTWRMGFRVRTASPEYMPLWYNLVQRRASRSGEHDG
jgi:8-amino-7-oxononanoate synthase